MISNIKIPEFSRFFFVFLSRLEKGCRISNDIFYAILMTVFIK
jgi:hypothetical protein